MINPFLLWGMVAVAVPIVIHLLMRQRPRPRPWAAMHWLRAAIRTAQRRYRLTNLLLLLLRCLALVLLALALARPAVVGLGASGELVVVVDLTTSMGPTASQRPLAQAAARLETADLDHPNRQLTIIGVGREVTQRYRGPVSDGWRALEQWSVDYAAGGLDQAASGAAADQLLSLLPAQATVILVSDFRQDRAEDLEALLRERVSHLHRLRVGEDGPNALVAEVGAIDDLSPGRSGTLPLRIQGIAEGAELRINDGEESRIALQAGAGREWQQLRLPPLAAGDHLLHLRVQDAGLIADSTLEYPLKVRDRVTSLSIAERLSYAGIALRADPQRMDHRRIAPSALGTTPLPGSGSLLLLRNAVSDPGKLLDWLRAGGVLWTHYPVLAEGGEWAAVREQLPRHREAGASGRLQAGMNDLDENFARSRLTDGAWWEVDPESEVTVLLRAGDHPLVVAVPMGAGMAIVEAQDLSPVDAVRITGATPEWVVRTARRVTQAQQQLPTLQSGTRVEQPWELQRDGQYERFAVGERAQLAPGLWLAGDEERPLVVLPNQDEGILRATPGSEDWQAVDALAGQQDGADWGWWLLAALLALLMGEATFAAGAGRRYGR